MIELYLIRHGETDLNVKKVYYGWTDCCLNETGRKQALKLKTLLEYRSFDVIISSPLIRAVETAKIISGVDHEDIIFDDRLKELNFGEWEGRHYKEISCSNKEHWDLWCKEWKSTPTPMGESFEDMYSRVAEFVDDFKTRHEDKRVLIVSHQGCLRLFPVLLLKLEVEACLSLVFEQGAYSKILIDEAGCILKEHNCGANMGNV